MESSQAQLWRTAYGVFEEALEQPESEQHGFVRQRAADPALQEIVFELLRNAGEEMEGCNSTSRRHGPGSKIGRYEVGQKLGRGGMGYVFAARDVELGRVVALKFLARQSGSPTRLIQEAKAASALNHPNIVTVYEVVREESEVALAMELVEGQSLRELCGTPQAPQRLANWGRQIAEALAATHALGIVHRDIKPENLMVRRDGFVKVLDFGLARWVPLPGTASQVSVHGVLTGTFHYMSPEMTRGEKPGQASDIFSLGVVLAELASGQHPFQADSPIDTAYAIAHHEWKAGVDLSAGWNQLLREMLAKDPAHRPAAEEVARRCGLLEKGDLPIRPPGISRRMVWAGAALAGGAAVGALGWFRRRASSEASRSPADEILRLEIPAGLEVADSFGTTLSISDDGKVIGAILRPANRQGPPAAYLWRNGMQDPRLVAGSEAAYSLILSPRGESVVVRQRRSLVRIDADGSRRNLAAIAGGPESGVWAGDDMLYYSSPDPKQPDRLTTVWRVPLDGSKAPQPLLFDDHPELGAIYFLVLQMMPDGRHLLISKSRSSFRTLFAFDLRTGKQKPLLEGINGGHYLSSGHVIHHRGVHLYAQRMNEGELSVTGAPVSVRSDVAQASWSGGNAALSRSGTLVYQTRDREWPDRTLVWVDLHGRETSLGLPPGPYEPGDISPNGEHVLIRRFDAVESRWSIWLLTLKTSEWRELESGLAGPGEVVWTPDGIEMIYMSSNGLARRSVFAGGPAQPITNERVLAHHPAPLFPGHRAVLITEGYRPVDGTWVRTVPLTETGKAQTVLRGDQHPALSPDGEWIATTYGNRVRIQPFPIRDHAEVADLGEGGVPLWSADGQWVHWRQGRKLMAARFVPGTPPKVLSSRVIVEGDFLMYTKWLRMMAYSPTTQRFLLAKNWRAQPFRSSIHVVRHFMDDVRRLCPPG